MRDGRGGKWQVLGQNQLFGMQNRFELHTTGQASSGTQVLLARCSGSAAEASPPHYVTCAAYFSKAKASRLYGVMLAVWAKKS